MERCSSDGSVHYTNHLAEFIVRTSCNVSMAQLIRLYVPHRVQVYSLTYITHGMHRLIIFMLTTCQRTREHPSIIHFNQLLADRVVNLINGNTHRRNVYYTFTLSDHSFNLHSSLLYSFYRRLYLYMAQSNL